MNRLILIGNGFDLAHGLKTSYKDFIYWYWEQKWREIALTYNHICEDKLSKFEIISGDTRSWHYIYHCNQIKLKDIKARDIFEAIINDKVNYKASFVPFFQNILKSIETKGWVDIENEYFSLLKEENMSIDKGFVTPNYKELNGHLDILRNKLIDFLRIEQTRKVKIFREIEDKIYRPIKIKEIAVANNNYFGNRLNKDIFPSNIMLLNFNYTTTPEMYLHNRRNISINYIHGRLDNPESVIFGYGDELDNSYNKLKNRNDNECLRHIKSIRYLESDNYRKMLEFIESAPFQICIMGHSCGNSDRTLLNTLFEHHYCTSIKPYYYVNKEGKDNYLDLTMNISRNFKDMKLMRDRVVNKMYCEALTE